MDTYHKIQTVFFRDPETNHKTLLEGTYARPEFEWLANNEWVFTEKIHGMNMRVMAHDWQGLVPVVSFGGKTDKANIPGDLIAHLQETFTPEKMGTVFGGGDVCLYGEGCGAGINKGGGYYKDKRFVLFDVKIDEWWLQRENVEDIASKLGIPVAPIIGTGTLPEMVELVRPGIKSTWGDFEAEGIVARPGADLLDRAGRRVITKLKCKDFPR
jgi:hypothetical protein